MLEDYRRSQSVLQEKLKNTNIFMQQEEEKVEQQIQQIQVKFNFDREKYIYIDRTIIRVYSLINLYYY